MREIKFRARHKTTNEWWYGSSAFQDGDLVTVDFGIIHQGLYTDHCFSVGLGNVNSEDKKLLEVGRQAVWQAAQKAVIGGTTGDIGSTILRTAEESGFTTAKKYTGHGYNYG